MPFRCVKIFFIWLESLKSQLLVLGALTQDSTVLLLGGLLDFVEILQESERRWHVEKGCRRVGGGLACIELLKNRRIFTQTRDNWVILNLTICCTQSDHLLCAKCAIKWMELTYFSPLVANCGTSVFPKFFKIPSLVWHIWRNLIFKALLYLFWFILEAH